MIATPTENITLHPLSTSVFSMKVSVRRTNWRSLGHLCRTGHNLRRPGWADVAVGGDIELDKSLKDPTAVIEFTHHIEHPA